MIYLQDTTHVGTKLRNLLLRASVFLPFGNSVISVSFLKFLISNDQANVPKDIHGLSKSDILPEDRQNFKSLEKIMEDRVIEALRKYVPGSEATILYIKICKYVTTSFLDPQLAAIERVYRMWYAVFLLRIWRSYIQSSKHYKLVDNFLTPNCYTCIELNAIELIRLILASSQHPELFLPNLFDSQPCERTFRQMRSMGTVNFTKINFTLMELLHMIERVELLDDIVHYKLANIAHFPRDGIAGSTENKDNHVPNMPSKEDIVLTISRAMNDAMQTAKEFELSLEPSKLQTCLLKEKEGQGLNARGAESETEEETDEESMLESITLRDDINLRGYGCDELSENSQYIQICENDGSMKNVRKSSIVWLLSDSKKKQSNDRLKRVQAIPSQKLSKPKAKRRKTNRMEDSQEDSFSTDDDELDLPDTRPSQAPSTSQGTRPIARTKPRTKPTPKPDLEPDIKIGDWSFFYVDLNNETLKRSLNLPEEIFIENVLLGSILSFQYKDGKNKSERQYHLDYVPQRGEQRKDIDVLSVWHVVGRDGELRTLGPHSSFHINLGNYIGKTNKPVIMEKSKKKLLESREIDVIEKEVQAYISQL